MVELAHQPAFALAQGISLRLCRCIIGVRLGVHTLLQATGLVAVRQA